MSYDVLIAGMVGSAIGAIVTRLWIHFARGSNQVVERVRAAHTKTTHTVPETGHREGRSTETLEKS